MVLQDDYLFGTTIRENILYSRPEACEDDVVGASKLANAHNFIVELPGGYDTKIGERGIKLSSGQSQRISIARAILRNPDILILDEATSCVDSQSERLIIEGAYKNLMRGRTTFIIAHRLSTIMKMDRIIVFQDGKIAEEGTHSDLITKQTGLYRMLWDLQSGGYVK